jgi:carbamoyl-phosphate synthase large subunit
MEHIEKAGIHSGDSACALPPYSLGDDQIERIKIQTRALARELGVIGLLNIQFAIKNETVYVLEVNPRASRTVPFVSKAIGVPLAKLATKVMLGQRLRDLGFAEEREVGHIAVKEAVFPFVKFPGVDVVLGPEMKSTGEVMGVSDDFGMAFAKAVASAGHRVPTQGTVFVSVNDNDKPGVLAEARALYEMGFRILASRGTADYLSTRGVPAETIFKVNEGRPNVVDLIKSHKIDIIFNTPLGRESRYDDGAIRKTQHGVLCVTTLTAAAATVQAIRALREGTFDVVSLQEIHA